MLNLKKMLIVGTVLSAFCATAFAAEEVQPPQPTMKEKVAAILHEDERPYPPQGKACKPPRRGPQLTPEQRAEHEKLRKEWKNMTPEQREKAKEKFRKERKEAHEKYAKETMKKLSPEQKAEVEQFIKDDVAQRQARKARLDNMTPEQREAIKANKPMPPKPPKDFDKHHKGEFRGKAPHGGPHHPGEFRGPAPHGGPHHPGEMPPAPQDMMD